MGIIVGIPEIVRRLHRNTRFGILLVSMAAVCFAAAAQKRIAQPASYHCFADHRTFWGISNFCNVTSNLPLLWVGVMGLLFLGRAGREQEPPFVDQRERWPYAAVFLAVALTCLGSISYHLAPNNGTLLWDRLPMSVIFVSVLAAIVAERISVRAGLILLPGLILLALGSVLQWYSSEARGTGDLRFYLVLQLLPALAIPLIVVFFPPRYTRGGDLMLVVALYFAAKIFEALDREIYHSTHVVSGHTLKHLFAAFAIYWVLRMLKRRIPVRVPRAIARAAVVC